jgi:hypothetical protein
MGLACRDAGVSNRECAGRLAASAGRLGNPKTPLPQQRSPLRLRATTRRWEWADHATNEVVGALTDELRLGAEMAEDPNNDHQIITRYVTDCRED